MEDYIPNYPDNDNKDDREENDYFESPDEPKPEKKPKPPVLKPEDPRYWENEESRWEHLKPKTRKTRFLWWLVAGAVAVAAGVALYLRYFSPYEDMAVQYGYVEHIRQEGLVFKTYEGVLIPYKQLMDTTRIYDRDFVFTAADIHLAAKLKRMQIARLPVRVSYRRYCASVPWRGGNTIVVTAVDSVDPNMILPPEYTPDVVKNGKLREGVVLPDKGKTKK